MVLISIKLLVVVIMQFFIHEIGLKVRLILPDFLLFLKENYAIFRK
ncbi:hypothetical protein HMPREF1052_1325 [Pasteurella bettyae CCUG 2042]|uniref:Uncharacterized protein n=1 Tax=Pasteurella bettyae CCUG 2042 TaxID=1095749 RepID=I3DAN8_9PAST|nr:hypothetical protein HMPREF1052_1325 [Pasteurella bettyae CCUG 2042]